MNGAALPFTCIRSQFIEYFITHMITIKNLIKIIQIIRINANVVVQFTITMASNQILSTIQRFSKCHCTR